ncbi:MAG TPA: prepilin-type N-terminal cleavage/methylation domain-containing protein [Myxococcota bacterium]|nr:prepilin-type N-terminal cleavage/methylation domain-containing protein [Myxococcota bacterium]
MRARREAGGFTLIELMIVVAIIGILAAIAIPNFVRFQLRSKTSEAKLNIAGIRTAEDAFFAEFGVYVSAFQTPTVFPSTQKNPWAGAGLAQFDQMGWAPEGDVFFVYAVNGGVPNAFAIAAIGDLDGAGQPSQFAYFREMPGLGVGPGPPIGTCNQTGVYNAVSGAPDLLNTVGPCTALDGQSQF